MFRRFFVKKKTRCLDLVQKRVNNKVKNLVRLQQKKNRDETGTYLVEGEHLVEEAYKDGSIIGGVFKIMFLVYLFGSTASVGKVIIVALIANLLIAAVPVGGGTISEMMILTMMGFPVAALPILTIIATIIDPPATMLNVVGDSASSMLVARVVDGKDWLNKKVKKTKKA